MIPVKIRRLNNEAMVPTKGTGSAAGFDIYLSEDEMVCSGGTTRCRTGIAVELPVGYEGQVRSRSGMSADGMVVANGVGTIDCDYRGELGVLLHNRGEWDRIIKAGTRVAQLVVQKVPDVVFIEVDELSDTARGEGGFGSSGVV